MALFEHNPHKHQPRNINEAHKQEQQGFNAKLAVLITRAFGTMNAFYVLVLWMSIWMALASVGFWLFAKDSYPFPFLLFCSNLVQLFALPILAVGQQVLSRKQELQAEEQFNTTEKSYHDIEEIMDHLNKQDEELIEQSKAIRTSQDELAKQTALLLQIANTDNSTSAQSDQGTPQ